MSANPKISIITCFLNAERFLLEAVNSVLQQTYPHWELLLIDDGSTDESTRMAQELAEQHGGKIFYMQHPGHQNRGSSASRNLGLQAARGELIAFLDADDLFEPDYLAVQVQTLEQQKVTMVCEATNYWYSWNSQYKDIIVPVGAAPGRVYAPPQLMLELYPLGKGAAPCICGMIIKKTAIEKHGGFDASFTGMYDEQVLLSRLYLHEAIYISGTCHNHYRQRPESLVGTSKGDRRAYLQVRKKFLEWLEGYLKDSGYPEGPVHRLLQQAFLPFRHPFYYFFVGTLPKKAAAIPRKAKNFRNRIFSNLKERSAIHLFF